MSDPTVPAKQRAGKHWWYTSTWSDPRKPGEKRGRAHLKRFGRCDRVTRQEAMRRWQRWLAKDFPTLQKAGTTRYSVDRLCRDYFEQMGKRYMVEGRYTTSIVRIRIALESFAARYGHEEADAMTAGAVAVWLEGYIHERLNPRKSALLLAHDERAQSSRPETPILGSLPRGSIKPRTKGTCNLALTYVKRMYRWGAKYGKVSDAAAGGVQLCENLRGDHPEVRQRNRITPVPIEHVEATQAVCEPEIAAAIKVLWLTGMRPGELLMMRPCDIERAGELRVYTPRHHKTAHRGKVRKIVLGPKAWSIIEPLLPTRTDAAIFGCPWTGKAWKDEGKFREAIRRRAVRAGVEPFNPNQLRHSYATRIQQDYGAEATQALLGHATLNQQLTYVERSLTTAMRVAREVG